MPTLQTIKQNPPAFGYLACRSCWGTGTNDYEIFCYFCSGLGWVQAEEDDVNIPFKQRRIKIRECTLSNGTCVKLVRTAWLTFCVEVHYPNKPFPCVANFEADLPLAKELFSDIAFRGVELW